MYQFVASIWYLWDIKPCVKKNESAATMNCRLMIYLRSDLAKNGGILQFSIFTEQNDLGDDLRRLGIVVHEGQEDPSSVLGVDGQHGDHGSAQLMYHTTA